MRKYKYVGPERILSSIKEDSLRKLIKSKTDILSWIDESEQTCDISGYFAATFIIDADRNLYIADRNSEHVACARGKEVLSAGEIFFELNNNEISVAEISNKSTGYCPEPESWVIVDEVLDNIGVKHPGEFTTEIIFRLCKNCGQRNIVKHDWFSCGACSSELDKHWNF